MGNGCGQFADFAPVYEPEPTPCNNNGNRDEPVLYNPTAKRYDCQLFNNDKDLIYDFHRYDDSCYQPQSLRRREKQFVCYVWDCNNYIRARFSVKRNKWIVTDISLHDNQKKITHKKDRHHTLYTPTATQKDSVALTAFLY